MALSVRSLFACWLAVVLTGTVVDHRHAAAANHTHGLGWMVLPAAPGQDELPVAHRHFVLLGIELGAVPGNAETGEGTGPAAGVFAPTESGYQTLAEVNPSLDSTIHPFGIVLAGIEFGSSDCVLTSQIWRSLCPLASRACTGVLRS